MRICYVLNQFPELSQTFVLRQIVDLLDRGHDVDVIAARIGNDVVDDATLWTASDRERLEPRTRYTGMRDGMLQRLLQGLALCVPVALSAPKVLATALDVRRFGWFAATGSLLAMGFPLAREQRRYHALVAHFGPQGMLAQGLREMGILSGPLATFFHAYDLTSAPRLAGRAMYRRLFERGELNLAISNRGAELLLQLGAPEDRVQVHHMGINARVFNPPDERRAIASSSVHRAVSIGRLVAKKGFDVGLRAVARAREKGIRLEYTIYGSGPLEAKLERRIDELGLRGTARLAGRASQAQLAVALKESDLLLAPSVTSRDGDEEGIPVVLMEAMATGLPVIASRSGGVAELVEHERSGLLVREGDADGLCGALCRLAASKDLRERLAHAGRERVLSDFNESVQGARLVELLAGLSAREGNGRLLRKASSARGAHW